MGFALELGLIVSNNFQIITCIKSTLLRDCAQILRVEWRVRKRGMVMLFFVFLQKGGYSIFFGRAVQEFFHARIYYILTVYLSIILEK